MVRTPSNARMAPDRLLLELRRAGLIASVGFPQDKAPLPAAEAAPRQGKVQQPALNHAQGRAVGRTTARALVHSRATKFEAVRQPGFEQRLHTCPLLNGHA